MSDRSDHWKQVEAEKQARWVALEQKANEIARYFPGGVVEVMADYWQPTVKVRFTQGILSGSFTMGLNDKGRLEIQIDTGELYRWVPRDLEQSYKGITASVDRSALSLAQDIGARCVQPWLEVLPVAQAAYQKEMDRRARLQSEVDWWVGRGFRESHGSPDNYLRGTYRDIHWIGGRVDVRAEVESEEVHLKISDLPHGMARRVLRFVEGMLIPPEDRERYEACEGCGVLLEEGRIGFCDECMDEQVFSLDLEGEDA